MIAGLDEALAKLPNKSLEELSNAEIEPIRDAMNSLHYILFGKTFLGTGNGYEITHSISIYLLQFFNNYLRIK